MLADINLEECLSKFNKFPKTKYYIHLNCCTYYQFITTSKSENECIDILKKITDDLVYARKLNFIVYAITNGEKRILYKGKTKSYND